MTKPNGQLRYLIPHLLFMKCNGSVAKYKQINNTFTLFCFYIAKSITNAIMEV